MNHSLVISNLQKEINERKSCKILTSARKPFWILCKHLFLNWYYKDNTYIKKHWYISVDCRSRTLQKDTCVRVPHKSFDLLHNNIIGSFSYKLGKQNFLKTKTKQILSLYNNLLPTICSANHICKVVLLNILL